MNTIMSAGGNLIFFGSVILILDVLIFSGFFPSQSLNDPTLHEPGGVETVVERSPQHRPI